MTEWFKDWFATDEYLSVYRHRDESDACKLFNLILDNINLPQDAEVLDFACGAGRYSLLFARKGYKVTGFDLCGNLLKIAKQNASLSGLNVNFFCTDLRQVCLKKKFDLVINLFTSFGYFENDDDNFKLFRSAYNHLKENSYFVFDYFNVEYLKSTLPRNTKDVYDRTIMIQKRFIDNNRVNKIIQIKKDDLEKQYMESVSLYDPDEIKCRMKKIGFDIKKIFGNYSGEEFNCFSSPRLIIVAQK